MFTIRRIFDDIPPANRSALDQVQAMLRSRFPLLRPETVEVVPDALRNPLKHRFRSILYVAEGPQQKVLGFALLAHEPVLGFGYLDYLVSDTLLAGRGVGGALYQRVREEAALLGATGLFFECLPDDPALCRDPVVLRQNRARLRFYEAHGARPIVNTAYETPIKPDAENPPYLMFDGLGRDVTLRRDFVKKVIASILETKYKGVCSPEYIRRVVDSVRNDPVQCRVPRYLESASAPAVTAFSSRATRMALVVTDQHEIHHVRDRGYVEAPVRIRTMLTALNKTGLFDPVPPSDFPDKWLTAVHRPAYVGYLKKVCEVIKPSISVYPYVFPIRNVTRPPVELPIRAGYYCIDTFTPINRNAYIAARRAVECALTAAREVLTGRRVAYALVRPPGHHAERGFFGGFCYFNNAAIAAHYLSRYGKVAMLDLDYHHGNGQQSIFYDRNDVLTVSLHGHPRFAYPYFSGFSDERGSGPGLGYNVNYPLPEQVDGQEYLERLGPALGRVKAFHPAYLVVCLGLDTAKGDPTGTWTLRGPDFREVGQRVAHLCLPTLVIQEGGYDNRSIGSNAAHFFCGLSVGIGTSVRILRNPRHVK